MLKCVHDSVRSCFFWFIFSVFLLVFFCRFSFSQVKQNAHSTLREMKKKFHVMMIEIFRNVFNFFSFVKIYKDEKKNPCCVVVHCGKKVVFHLPMIFLEFWCFFTFFFLCTRLDTPRIFLLIGEFPYHFIVYIQSHFVVIC